MRKLVSHHQLAASMKQLVTNYLTAQSTSPVYDQRSYDAYMNLEHHSQPTFETRLRAGPVPKVSLSDYLGSVLTTNANVGKLAGLRPSH
jgi:hypothetical protein